MASMDNIVILILLFAFQGSKLRKFSTCARDKYLSAIFYIFYVKFDNDKISDPYKWLYMICPLDKYLEDLLFPHQIFYLPRTRGQSVFNPAFIVIVQHPYISTNNFSSAWKAFLKFNLS